MKLRVCDLYRQSRRYSFLFDFFFFHRSDDGVRQEAHGLPQCLQFALHRFGCDQDFLYGIEYKFNFLSDFNLYKVLVSTEIGNRSHGSRCTFGFHCSAPGCAVKTFSRIRNRINGKGNCASCAAKTGSVVCTEKPNHVIPFVKMLIDVLAILYLQNECTTCS